VLKTPSTKFYQIPLNSFEDETSQLMKWQSLQYMFILWQKVYTKCTAEI